MNYKKSLLLLPLAVLMAGCLIRPPWLYLKHNTYRQVQESMDNQNFKQAAERLKRCAFMHKEQGCIDILNEAEKSGIPVAEFLERTHMGHYRYVKQSMENKWFAQAAKRLEWCVDDNKEKECIDLMSQAKKSGLPVATFLTEQYQEQMRQENERILAEEKKRSENSLRSSENPWDKLRLAFEIENGNIEKAYPGEANAVFKEAFFGFGECAKNNKPACMAMYGDMILKGETLLDEKEKKDARKKAIYWLNLAARYGDEEARKSLLSIEQPIPSPDLAMARMQQEANEIAAQDAENRRRAIELQRNIQEQRAYYNQQMIAQQRRSNYLQAQANTETREANRLAQQRQQNQSFNNMMGSFFPQTVRCTSHTIGGMTYTDCR